MKTKIVFKICRRERCANISCFVDSEAQIQYIMNTWVEAHPILARLGFDIICLSTERGARAFMVNEMALALLTNRIDLWKAEAQGVRKVDIPWLSRNELDRVLAKGEAPSRSSIGWSPGTLLARRLRLIEKLVPPEVPERWRVKHETHLLSSMR